MKKDFDQRYEEIKTEQETNIVEQKESVSQPVRYDKIDNVNVESDFTKAINQTKLDVIDEAKVNDAEFSKNFAKQIKDSATKLAEVEKEKAILEQQNVKYHEELLETQQKLNEHTQDKNSLEHKTICRKYHYDGVSSIMEFVGIKNPMNVVLLYFLVLVLLIPFLISKLFKGTVGALIAGTEDEDRSKTAKGFMWTILALLILFAATLSAYWSLNWLNII